jgi:glycosyltransferase involved in cell wall biosynthesis
MRVRGKASVATQQSKYLHEHRHDILEEVIHERLEPLRDRATVQTGVVSSPPGQRLSIGIATPWSPQRTGVADYSAAVFTALTKYADVTVYTTADADVRNPEIKVHSVDEVLDDPDAVSERHDAFICVLGNSHFHLVFEQILSAIDAYVLHHDARMIEYYMSLRGAGGVQQLMLMTADESAPRSVTPSLDDQVDDMRLLQNAGFWEVANRARDLFVHTPGSAPRIEVETGRQVQVLPFANYRAPAQDVITESDRERARGALGLDAYPPGTIHLGSFGYVDIRTKMNDIVVEAAAWLSQWGHSVALHFVGAAAPRQAEELQARAESAGLTGFQITGFTGEEEFRNWLLAVDLGVQLRISPLLGVSGPLSDLAAYGTPAVASRGLCVDVDPPAFISPLPDAVSPVMVAEAIEQAIGAPMAPEDRERLRKAYVEEKSPDRYAQALLGLLESRI